MCLHWVMEPQASIIEAIEKTAIHKMLGIHPRTIFDYVVH